MKNNLQKKIILTVLMLLPSIAISNDFPTQARLEYALLCMKDLGGQTIQNLYACSCAVDKFAGKISHDKFVEAETLRAMIKTPGEKGGAFRDVPGARKLLRSIDEMKQNALSSCTVTVPSSSAVSSSS